MVLRSGFHGRTILLFPAGFSGGARGHALLLIADAKQRPVAATATT